MTGKTNSANKKIELEEITVSPGASNVVRTAEDGKGFSKVTVPGDTDLVAANIRENIDIFGILGTLKEGITGIDFGTVTVSSGNTVTVAHSLGTTPKTVMLIPKSGLAKPSSTNTYDTNMVINTTATYVKSFGTATSFADGSCSTKKTANNITFRAYEAGYFIQDTYIWYAIA